MQLLKQELSQLEEAQTKHILPGGPKDRDPDKMADRIKKLRVCLDLTTQRCEQYAAKLNQLEGRYSMLFVNRLLIQFFLLSSVNSEY